MACMVNTIYSKQNASKDVVKDPNGKRDDYNLRLGRHSETLTYEHKMLFKICKKEKIYSTSYCRYFNITVRTIFLTFSF